MCHARWHENVCDNFNQISEKYLRNRRIWNICHRRSIDMDWNWLQKVVFFHLFGPAVYNFEVTLSRSKQTQMVVLRYYDTSSNTHLQFVLSVCWHFFDKCF